MTAAPSDELIVYRDDETGERAALTAAELGDWAAATAALLTDGCGLRRGARAAVLLPAHWQTAAVLLGAWSVGIEVSFRGWSTAGLAPAGDPVDVSFVALHRVGSWLDDVPSAAHQFVLGLPPAAPPAPARSMPAPPMPAPPMPAPPAPAPPAPAPSMPAPSMPAPSMPAPPAPAPSMPAPPVGAPPLSAPAVPAPPAGYRDFLTAVRPYLGAPAPVPDAAADRRAAVDGTTFGEYGAVAAGIAEAQSITRGDRVLIDASRENPLFWLLAPLSAGASVVLCRNLAPGRLDDLIAEEHITRSVI